MNLFSWHWHKIRKGLCLCYKNGKQRHTERKIWSIQELQVLNLRYQESWFSEQSMCLCVYEYICPFCIQCVHIWIYIHTSYKALHLFKGLLLLGSSTALCALIFSAGQENEGPMRTTITELGGQRLSGSPLWTLEERAPGCLHRVFTPPLHIRARNLQISRKSWLIFGWTIPSRDQILRHEAAKIYHFRRFVLHDVSKGLHVKSPPIEEVTPCQISDHCFEA